MRHRRANLVGTAHLVGPTAVGRSTTALLGAGLALWVLSGCTPSTQSQGVDALSLRVDEVRAEISEAFASEGDSADVETLIGPEIASDLRGLTEEESRQVGRPLTGYYELDRQGGDVSVELVIVSRVNSGGFTNTTESFLTCVRFDGELGASTVTTTARDCPDWLLDVYNLHGTKAFSVDDLDL